MSSSFSVEAKEAPQCPGPHVEGFRTSESGVLPWKVDVPRGHHGCWGFGQVPFLVWPGNLGSAGEGSDLGSSVRPTLNVQSCCHARGTESRGLVALGWADPALTCVPSWPLFPGR